MKKLCEYVICHKFYTFPDVWDINIHTCECSPRIGAIWYRWISCLLVKFSKNLRRTCNVCNVGTTLQRLQPFCYEGLCVGRRWIIPSWNRTKQNKTYQVSMLEENGRKKMHLLNYDSVSNNSFIRIRRVTFGRNFQCIHNNGNEHTSLERVENRFQCQP